MAEGTKAKEKGDTKHEDLGRLMEKEKENKTLI